VKPNVIPYEHSALGKKEQVAAMFNNIAWRYDFLNRFLSLGIDKWWRRKTIRILGRALPQGSRPVLLDIATGTADLALAACALKPARVFGIDISEDMLKLGRKKIAKKGLQATVELLEGDSEKLFFDDNKFDAVTVGFGVRNFENLEQGLHEIKRVLKPGGTAMILEFSKPHAFPVKQLHHFYSSTFCPWIGRMVSRDSSAYAYLYESVEAFPSGDAFRVILEKAGFTAVHIRPLTFGIVSVYSCKKP
jgi:demethylmenaquinone methyltransferase/2-methoxy-6-polyprenyl-1,4-benzoquinol methylase